MSENDRAWNDPPPINYTAMGGPRRTLLNKRVAFPLSSSQNREETKTVASQDIKLLPPSDEPSKNVAPVPLLITNIEKFNVKEDESLSTKSSSNKSSVTDSAADCDLSNPDMLNFVITTFETIMLKEDSEKKLEDIKSRISVLRDMWNEKLSNDVKKMMYKLAKELSVGNYDAADTLHCSLIVDHVNEVKQWMVGVKHIIQIARIQPDTTQD